jgi:hypothetical protein
MYSENEILDENNNEMIINDSNLANMDLTQNSTRSTYV